MKVYKLQSLEQYKSFVLELISRDQPNYVYESENFQGYVIVSDSPLDNPDNDIDELQREILERKLDDIILDEDEPLFDYDDDDELGLIL